MAALASRVVRSTRARSRTPNTMCSTAATGTVIATFSTKSVTRSWISGIGLIRK
jgi:hypothetical protein